MENKKLKLGIRPTTNDEAYKFFIYYAGYTQHSFNKDLRDLFDKYTLHKCNTNLKQQLIIEFVKKYNRLPSSSSKDKEERKLGIAIHNYRLRKNLHLEFLQYLEELCIKLNIRSKNHTDIRNRNYIDVINFIKENNRKPSQHSKDKEEKRLGVILNGCKTNKQKYIHTEFIEEVDELCKKLGVVAGEQRIINFIKENKRNPSKTSQNKEERKLSRLSDYYKLSKQKHLHVEFIKQVEDLYQKLDIKIIKHDSNKVKIDIINFIKNYKKLPNSKSKNSIERKLGSALNIYIKSDREDIHGEFIKQIESLCKKLDLRRRGNVKQNYTYIINFIKENNRKPSQCSKNSIECTLSNILYNYKSGKQKNIHTEFIKQVEDLLKEIKGE